MVATGARRWALREARSLKTFMKSPLATRPPGRSSCVTPGCELEETERQVGVSPGDQIVGDDSPASRQPLGSPGGLRFDDVHHPEQQEGPGERHPGEWQTEESDEKPGRLVDDHATRILSAQEPRGAPGGRDRDSDDHERREGETP